jgi:hypothetical protein
VAEPFLYQVERDAGGDGGHPETVPQPFRRGRTPSRPAACITACIARQPVIRDHGQSRM